MVKKICNIFKIKNEQQKTRVFITFITVISVCLLVFFVFELNMNRICIIDLYNEEQQNKVEQICELLEFLASEKNTELTEKNITDFLSNYVEVSSTVWPFLCTDTKVVFVKNKDTTDQTQDKNTTSFYEFTDNLKKLNYMLNYETIIVKGEAYYLGLASDTEFILESSQINKHTIYVLTTITVLSCLLYGLWVFYFFKLSKVNKSLAEMEKNFEKRNILFQQLSDENTRLNESIINLQAQKTLNSGDTRLLYDVDLVISLLKKTTDPALFPFSIIHLKILMAEGKYYGKGKIHGLVKPIVKYLNNKQILSEIGKGEFIILMYHTDYETAKKIKEQIKEYWCGISGNTIQLYLNFTSVAENELPIDVFNKMLEEANAVINK